MKMVGLLVRRVELPCDFQKKRFQKIKIKMRLDECMKMVGLLVVKRVAAVVAVSAKGTPQYPGPESSSSSTSSTAPSS